MSKELLPLPKGIAARRVSWEKTRPEYLFTADQMREYALDNLQAAKPAEARNFCPTCGKRLHSGSIHTCTPPAPDQQAKDAARYRRIRNGPHSDQHGDLYAMVFSGKGDIPVHGDALDYAVDLALSTTKQEEV